MSTILFPGGDHRLVLRRKYRNAATYEYPVFLSRLLLASNACARYATTNTVRPLLTRDRGRVTWDFCTGVTTSTLHTYRSYEARLAIVNLSWNSWTTIPRKLSIPRVSRCTFVSCSFGCLFIGVRTSYEFGLGYCDYSTSFTNLVIYCFFVIFFRSIL